MALFENCSIVLELKTLPHKEKKRLGLTLTEHGGSISYVVNKQCSLVVASSVSSLSSNRLRSIQKHHTPVVAVDYVYACVERGVLLPVDQHKLDTSPSPLPLSSLGPVPPSQPVSNVTSSSQGSEQSNAVNVISLTTAAGRQAGIADVVDQLRVETESQSDVPTFPSDFQVAKYSIFEKADGSMWGVVELQSATGEQGQRYRVVRKATGPTVSLDKVVLVSTSEQAVKSYQTLMQALLDAGLTLTHSLHPQASALLSDALKQLLLEEKLNTGSVSQEVGVFVELLWRESLGCLGNVLKVPISSLSLNDVSRAEGLLLQAWKKVKENTFSDVAEVHSVTEDFYTLLPHRENNQLLNNASIISHKLDLCQLIRDVLNVSEVTLRSPSPSCLGKYRALRCSIEKVPLESNEFKDVSQLLRHSNVQVQQMLRISRGAELHTFRKELGNNRLLLHASSPSSFVGILSRGLLLPTVGVKHHGIERTDIGDLGSGIYFSDSISTSLKYSKPSVTDGSRLLLVCDVALGECRDLHRKDPSLCQAPEGYHSVHGVRRTPNTQSEFQDDEFVVYATDQVRLRFVVQFTVEGDPLQEFHPSLDTSSELPPLPSTLSTELVSDEDSIWSSENPLDKVTAGLLDSSGQQLPLQAVHVKCKLMDLLSQVIIFQKYTNQSSVPIEAKYVFPLDECAAVCGFEAFINGKHVVGQVKEKEQARKEYKQAVAKGHGAYLMDQDAPDVFTISVGNLPPGATVLIKVTFVSELIVRDGHVVFSLPGSVAPWQESAALNQTTQATVKKVCVTDRDAKGEFSLDMSIDMPYEITSLKCDTHKVRIKKTACKAVVSVVPGEALGSDGFQLAIKLSQIHLPRMWVENHPDKDSQASMLVFYPDFEVSSSGPVGCDEVVLLLDSSESMQGEALHNARAIALKLLEGLRHSARHWKANVILFGTEHKDAFLAAQDGKVSYLSAKKFIQSHPPVGGSTELWRPLRALSLLPPSRGLRNLLLLSDGHIQNPDLTLRLVRDTAQHSRLFTCGLSPTANRHMLRALAQAGGGAYEFFDTKTKHTWSAKVSSQVRRMASPGCSSVSVKWQQFNPRAPPAVQAPAQLHALFNDCHTLVYGFVPHCTQASLHGNLSGQEINTMVSTSELQKTKGTFLHKLTARALIRDYEDGNLGSSEAEHEEKKAELKSFIVELSKEYSILSQFTSFVAIEERDSERTQQESFTDVHKLVSEEDVDFLPYLPFSEEEAMEEEEEEEAVEIDSPIMRSSSRSRVRYATLSSPDAEETLSYSSLSDAENTLWGSCLSRVGAEQMMDMGVGSWSMDMGVLGELSAFSSSSFFSYSAPPICSDLPPPVMMSPTMTGSALRSLPMMGSAMMGSAKALPSPPPPPPPPPHTSFNIATRASSYSSPSSISRNKPPKERSRKCSNSQPHHRHHHHLSFSAAPPWSQEDFRCPPSGLIDSFSPPSPPPPPPPPPPVVSFRNVPLESEEMETDGDAGESLRRASGRVRRGFPDLSSTSLAGSRRVKQSEMCASTRGFASPTITHLSKGAPPPHFYFGSTPAFGAPPPHTPLARMAGMAGPPPLTPPSAVGGPTLFGSLLHTPLARMAGMAGPQPLTPHSAMDAPQPWAIAAQTPQQAPQRPIPPSAMDAPPPFTPPSARATPPHFIPARAAPQTTTNAPFTTLVPSVEWTKPLRFEDTRPLRFEGPPSKPIFEGGTLQSTGASRSVLRYCAPPAVQQPCHGYVSDICESVPAELECKSRNLGRTLSLPRKTTAPNTSTGEREDRPQQRQRKQLLPPCGTIKYISSSHLISQQQQQQQTEYTVFTQKLSKNMKWESIFLLQHTEGYWECTAELGGFIRVALHSFANVFLKNKGIFSLGVRARADILRLLATLLVLQLMRMEQLEEGKLLRTLLSLEDPPQARPERWEAVKKAVDWACGADRQYPCVCSRLEMGWSWESFTRQLLGYDQPAPHSPFAGLTHWRLGPQLNRMPDLRAAH